MMEKNAVGFHTWELLLLGECRIHRDRPTLGQIWVPVDWDQTYHGPSDRLLHCEFSSVSRLLLQQQAHHCKYKQKKLLLK